MATLDELNRQRPPAEAEAEAMEEIPVDEEQVEFVTRLAVKMMKDGNVLATLEKALNQSDDPAQVVGQFLVQLISQLAEVVSQEVDMDPRIFMSKGGFIDHILDYIEKQLSLPEEFSDQVYNEVVEMIRGLAMGEQQPSQPQQPGVEQAPMEQAAPAQAGGIDQMGMMG